VAAGREDAGARVRWVWKGLVGGVCGERRGEGEGDAAGVGDHGVAEGDVLVSYWTEGMFHFIEAVGEEGGGEIICFFRGRDSSE